MVPTYLHLGGVVGASGRDVCGEAGHLGMGRVGQLSRHGGTALLVVFRKKVNLCRGHVAYFVNERSRDLVDP